MSVTPTSYEAQVPAAAVTQLARVAAFQAAGGVASEAAARGKIIEVSGGPMDDSTRSVIASDGSSLVLHTASAFAHVAPEAWEQAVDTPAWLVFLRSGSLPIRLYLRLNPALNPPDQVRTVLNTLGAIRAGMDAGFGAAGCFVAGSITTRLDSLGSETGWSRTFAIATLTLDWKALP